MQTAIKTSVGANAKSAQNSALGILTKSPSNNLPQCNVSSEYIDTFRLADYILQDISGNVLGNKHRVKFCLKRKIDKHALVNVCFNESTSKAHYGNVIRCGSLWTCPVCAKKITEERRKLLTEINKKWKAGMTLYTPEKMAKDFVGPPVFHAEKISQGYSYLLTLTSPHYAYQSLEELKVRHKMAKEKLFSGSTAIKINNLLGKRFQITAMEVTYGANGWHPHSHILILSDRYLSIHDFSEAHEFIAKRWSKCLENFGSRKLKPNELRVACDLRDGTYAEKYVGKWGVEHEITKGHIKKGKDSFTPFDLLRCCENDELIFGRKPSDLFRHFADAFKGVRQLYMGSIKHHFKMQEKTEAEIMAETLNEAIFLRDVEDYTFKLICKYKKRAEFLDCVTQDHLTGSFTAEQLIVDLEELERKHVEADVIPSMLDNSKSMTKFNALPSQNNSTPWVSTAEFAWLESIKKQQQPIFDIDESHLVTIAEHLAWLECERSSA